LLYRISLASTFVITFEEHTTILFLQTQWQCTYLYLAVVPVCRGFSTDYHRVKSWFTGNEILQHWKVKFLQLVLFLKRENIEKNLSMFAKTMGVKFHLISLCFTYFEQGWWWWWSVYIVYFPVLFCNDILILKFLLGCLFFSKRSSMHFTFCFFYSLLVMYIVTIF
jgi:hypothetical protein